MGKLLIIFLTFILVPYVTLGAVKDSDADGLTDEGEMSIYRTDGTVFDTDGDGVGDGEEVLDGTNPTDPADSRVTEIQAKANVGFLGESTKFAWYLGRTSGIVAFILFSLVVIYGLLVSNAKVYVKWIFPPTSLAFHTYFARLAFAVVALHALSFIFDGYIQMAVSEAVVPFLLSRPFHSAMGYNIGYTVALGILALYIMLITAITAVFRKNIFSRTWRKLHYMNFVAYVLFLAHGFTAEQTPTNGGCK